MDRPETFSKAIGASDKAGVGGGPCKLNLANRLGDNLRKRGRAAITRIDDHSNSSTGAVRLLGARAPTPERRPAQAPRSGWATRRGQVDTGAEPPTCFPRDFADGANGRIPPRKCRVAATRAYCPQRRT